MNLLEAQRCLEERGYATPKAPDKSTFVVSGGTWSPFAALPNGTAEGSPRSNEHARSPTSNHEGAIRKIRRRTRPAKIHVNSPWFSESTTDPALAARALRWGIRVWLEPAR